MATVAELKQWIERDLLRFGRFDLNVEVLPLYTGCDFRFRIYTDTNAYSISARNGLVSDTPPMRGYLGCIASCRKPRAGEDWQRGSDLADGPLTEDTWHKILGDIVSYELVKVHRPKPAVPDHVHEFKATGGEGTGHGSVERSACACGATRTIEIRESAPLVISPILTSPNLPCPLG